VKYPTKVSIPWWEQTCFRMSSCPRRFGGKVNLPHFLEALIPKADFPLNDQRPKIDRISSTFQTIIFLTHSRARLYTSVLIKGAILSREMNGDFGNRSVIGYRCRKPYHNRETNIGGMMWRPYLKFFLTALCLFCFIPAVFGASPPTIGQARNQGIDIQNFDSITPVCITAPAQRA